MLLTDRNPEHLTQGGHVHVPDGSASCTCLSGPTRVTLDSALGSYGCVFFSVLFLGSVYREAKRTPQSWAPLF